MITVNGMVKYDHGYMRVQPKSFGDGNTVEEYNILEQALEKILTSRKKRGLIENKGSLHLRLEQD